LIQVYQHYTITEEDKVIHNIYIYIYMHRYLITHIYLIFSIYVNVCFPKMQLMVFGHIYFVLIFEMCDMIPFD
jgi:hypothetical protein